LQNIHSLPTRFEVSRVISGVHLSEFAPEGHTATFLGCIDGKSMAAPCVNLFLAPTHSTCLKILQQNTRNH